MSLQLLASLSSPNSETVAEVRAVKDVNTTLEKNTAFKHPSDRFSGFILSLFLNLHYILLLVDIVLYTQKMQIYNLIFLNQF